MPGNQFGDKLNDAQKQVAYTQYCDHIAKGFSKDAWSFIDPEKKIKSLTWNTMDSYIKNDPTAFDSSQMDKAMADAKLYFETEGLKMMTGENPKGSAAIFQIFMRNKFGWDKDKKEEDKVINVSRE